jgi:hypothetical protein
MLPQKMRHITPNNRFHERNQRIEKSLKKNSEILFYGMINYFALKI